MQRWIATQDDVADLKVTAFAFSAVSDIPYFPLGEAVVVFVARVCTNLNDRTYCLFDPCRLPVPITAVPNPAAVVAECEDLVCGPYSEWIQEREVRNLAGSRLWQTRW
jgi:hypothetical protein